MEHFYHKIIEIAPKIAIKCNEPLKNHTSFRIGGPAALMAFPKNAQELSLLLRLAAESQIDFRILGSGTNVLMPDEGLCSLVICTKDALTGLSLCGAKLTAMAGQSLAKTAAFARDHALSGMECLHGVPGSVGGGVFMNAGAYDSDIAAVCTKVTVMDYDGSISEHTENLFSYRNSVFQSMRCIILSAEFSLRAGDPGEIAEKMKTLAERRRSAQPLELPSAGSAFKRPEGHFAGRLIEQAGLKGFRIGDAAVSEKHAGFIVNLGHATANDVKALIAEIQGRVEAASGVHLEPEIRIW